jgi:hypothetical protein
LIGLAIRQTVSVLPPDHRANDFPDGYVAHGADSATS